MQFNKKSLTHPAGKAIVFIVLLLPLVFLIYATLTQQLGANPAEKLTRETGEWALRILVLVLAVTPLRVITNTPQLARYRRMIGLFVFFYASLHLLTYLSLDREWVLSDIAKDILKRPFILVGFAAFCWLILLAGTSFNAAIKAMGAKNWQALHRAVYLIAALSLLHYFWMRTGKNNFASVAVYAALIGALLAWRLWWAWDKRKHLKESATMHV